MQYNCMEDKSGGLLGCIDEHDTAQRDSEADFGRLEDGIEWVTDEQEIEVSCPTLNAIGVTQ